MDYKKLAAILIFMFLMGTVYAVAPEITVTSPTGDSLFSHRDTTITIDFNISDPDTNVANGVLVDFNFSTSTTDGTGTVIIVDLNLSDASCSSDDLSSTVQCSTSFNSIAVTSSGTFFILALADDQNAAANTNFDANGSFVFTKLSKEDALCASISDDLSTANGCVDEDGFEDSTTSSLSIGMLELGDSSGIIILMFVLALIAVIGVGIMVRAAVLRKKIPFIEK